MNKLKTTPANKYNSDYTDEQLKDALISFAVLIVGFIALFLIICQATNF
ncbi:MAG: hypothetical protein ACR2IJ_07740 [Fluviibacter sp.]